MPPALLFLLRIVLAIWALFWFHIKFKVDFSNSVKKVNGSLIGIALNLYFGSMAILTILILPIHEHGMFSICYCPLLFPWAVVCSSPWRGHSHISLVNCISRYFIPFVAVVSSSLMIWLFVYYWCIGMLVIFAHWFWILRLLKLLISFRIFWAETMGFSKYTIKSSPNRDNLTFCLPIWIHFISFSCLIALTRTSNTMLNRSGERERASLSCAGFQRECFQFLTIQYDIGCRFVVNSFYYFEICSINT